MWPSSSANVYILPDVLFMVWSAFDLVICYCLIKNVIFLIHVNICQTGM